MTFNLSTLFEIELLLFWAYGGRRGAKPHSNCDIKGWKSGVKWNLHAIITVTLRSSDYFVDRRDGRQQELSPAQVEKTSSKREKKKKSAQGRLR